MNTITKAHVVSILQNESLLFNVRLFFLFIKYWNGTIKWNPPVIYKSYCAINITDYPFDVQNCSLKFGTWSHNGNLVGLWFFSKSKYLISMNFVLGRFKS